jgi:arginase family enzyme
MITRAFFFPFDLFGSAGTKVGAELLADAVREMLEDNRRETVPTRARAYTKKVRVDEFSFETLADFDSWRRRAHEAITSTWAGNDFLLWCSGNHLGTMPIYAELGRSKGSSVVVQLDAHLDICNLADCSESLSHGNFLLHVDGRLPSIINLGHRDLLLPAEYVAKYYKAAVPASTLLIDPEPALEQIRTICRAADRVVIDIDCDVFDPAYFPAVTNPLPFGMTPALLLRILDAAWQRNVVGVALSEFCPAHDRDDRSLALLIWLIEHLLLRRHEAR